MRDELSAELGCNLAGNWEKVGATVFNRQTIRVAYRKQELPQAV